MRDMFQSELTTSKSDTIVRWNAAIESYLGFRGSPVGEMEAINDPAFVMGSVFCAAMKLLSGVDPNGESVAKNVRDMRNAAPDATSIERTHVAAVETMLTGEFSKAARQWDTILIDHPGDILAHKCAHETWFLVGDAVSMRASSNAALERLSLDDPAFGVAAAQHGFALEETGAYAEAESWGRLALELQPEDCWALHCLAHIYETQNRHFDAMALFDAKKPIWSEQNLLNAHIWWHLALRQIEIRDFDAALAVFDTFLVDVPASNRFRLTDGTSLLWRLELEGIDVGDRWATMADKWAKSATLHTNAFLDLHAALAFSRCPDTSAASLYFESLLSSFDGQTSENAQTFHEVVKPLSQAFARLAKDPVTASLEIERILPELHRIGGSIVQREIVERSYSSALLATEQATKARTYLAPKLTQNPNASWVLRQAAAAAQAQGDRAQATLLRRRADVMFVNI